MSRIQLVAITFKYYGLHMRPLSSSPLSASHFLDLATRRNALHDLVRDAVYQPAINLGLRAIARLGAPDTRFTPQTRPIQDVLTPKTTAALTGIARPPEMASKSWTHVELDVKPSGWPTS